MKWKTLAPKLGDEKTEVRFAFFPVYTDDGYTVWLEEYVVHLRYETRYGPAGGHTAWFNIKTESYTRQKSILKKIESTMTNPIREYDNNGNLIHTRDSAGYESWYEYDNNGNCIHSRDSSGRWPHAWREYDTNGNLIHLRYSDGYEWWGEYDTNGRMIHRRDSNGFEEWYERDDNGNLVNTRTNND